jgi:hypothetical protein
MAASGTPSEVPKPIVDKPADKENAAPEDKPKKVSKASMHCMIPCKESDPGAVRYDHSYHGGGAGWQHLVSEAEYNEYMKGGMSATQHKAAAAAQSVADVAPEVVVGQKRAIPEEEKAKVDEPPAKRIATFNKEEPKYIKLYMPQRLHPDGEPKRNWTAVEVPTEYITDDVRKQAFAGLDAQYDYEEVVHPMKGVTDREGPHATLVHGIDGKDAKDSPESRAKAIANFWTLVERFNAKKFEYGKDFRPRYVMTKLPSGEDVKMPDIRLLIKPNKEKGGTTAFGIWEWDDSKELEDFRHEMRKEFDANLFHAMHVTMLIAKNPVLRTDTSRKDKPATK